MAKYLFVYLIFGINLYSVCQDTSYIPASDCVNFNKFRNDTTTMPQLWYYSDLITEQGTMIFNNFTGPNFGSITDHLNLFSMNNQYSFQLENQIPSQFSNDAAIKIYQEYYNGVKVDGGGYSIKVRTVPDNPCGEVTANILMSPYFLTEISINTSPQISSASVHNILLQNILNNTNLEFNNPELVISHNLLNNCAYNLAWKVNFNDGNNKIAWIDAHTGIVLKITISEMEMEAQTELYGPQNLNDHTTNMGTLLETPDGKIKTYNFNNTSCPSTSLNKSQWTESLIPKSQNSTWGNEAGTDVYQLHHVVNTVLPFFDEIGVNFTNVRAGSCASVNNSFALSNDLNDAFILIGRRAGQTLACYDVVAHELTHIFLRKFLDYDNLGNGSLHEGISDIIGTYIESKIQTLDWIWQDDNGRNVRNLSNLSCYNDFKNSEVHDRGKPLGHWFYLITTGNSQSGIQGLGISESLKLLLEGITLIGKQSDYPKLREAILSIAISKYGLCSIEYLSIIRAWNKIWCESLWGGCPYTISGPSWVCEESNQVQFCEIGGPPNSGCNWTIIGPRSTEWVCTGTQIGNSVINSQCLTVTHFPTYDYYPQFFTIQAYMPIAGSKFVQYKSFKLVDCDEDDLTCEEYYYPQHPLTKEINIYKSISDVEKKMEVFNILGISIYKGEIIDASKFNSVFSHQLLTIIYYNQEGKICNIKKIMTK